MEIIGFLQAESQVMSMDGHLTIRFNSFKNITNQMSQQSSQFDFVLETLTEA